jgi:hypothetical protein
MCDSVAARLGNAAFEARLLFWFDKLVDVPNAFVTFMSNSMASRLGRDTSGEFQSCLVEWFEVLGRHQFVTFMSKGGFVVRLHRLEEFRTHLRDKAARLLWNGKMIDKLCREVKDYNSTTQVDPDVWRVIEKELSTKNVSTTSNNNMNLVGAGGGGEEEAEKTSSSSSSSSSSMLHLQDESSSSAACKTKADVCIPQSSGAGNEERGDAKVAKKRKTKGSFAAE